MGQTNESSLKQRTHMIGRHGRNCEGVVRGSGAGGSPGITPSADAAPLRRGRRPLVPVVVMLLLVVVAVTAGRATSAAARRVGGRGGRRQPRRLAAALHGVVPHYSSPMVVSGQSSGP